MATEKTGDKQASAGNGRFKPGESGNPGGRPKGSRNKVTLAVERILEGQAEALTQKVIERGLAGDAIALRLALDRLCPPRRDDRPAPFEMPALKEAADARDAFAAIICATADGELTPSEAATLAKLVSDFAAIDAATQTQRSLRETRNRLPPRLKFPIRG
jgi:Family of unknown function (DUF5681)